MEIIYFETIDSTQKYLLNNLKDGVCIWTEKQTDGIGSRGNSWIGEDKNLFFSFVIKFKDLPKDLPLVSISIYFMFQMKLLLSKLGSNVLFKWPNDLYLSKKIAGVITNKKGEFVIVGIGINTNCSTFYQSLDIDIKNIDLLTQYFDLLTKKQSWKEVFKLYKEEFEKTKSIFGLEDFILCDDGSLKKDNQRIYSLR